MANTIDDLVSNPLDPGSFWGNPNLDLCNVMNFSINLVAYIIFAVMIILVVVNLFTGIYGLFTGDTEEDFQKVQKAITGAVFAAIGAVLVSSALFIPVNFLSLLGIEESANPFLTRLQCP